MKDDELTNREKKILIESFDTVFSLDLLKYDDKQNLRGIDEDEVNRLITERKEARDNKNWSKADEIRDKLSDMGIEILDSKSGTTWRVKR
jgi:cysteinyl-tRNA synthetase